MLFCNARAMQVGSSTLHPRATCCHCPTINHLLKTQIAPRADGFFYALLQKNQV